MEKGDKVWIERQTWQGPSMEAGIIECRLPGGAYSVFTIDPPGWNPGVRFTEPVLSEDLTVREQLSRIDRS